MKKLSVLILLVISISINSFSQENNLNIASLPIKLTYLMGEDLDLTGLLVISDDVELTNSEYTVNGNTFLSGIIPIIITENTTQNTTFFNITVDSTLINTGLPVIYIETQYHQEIVSKEDYIKMNIKIVDQNNPDNYIENNGYKDNIRGRGNDSWNWPKKPYRIKLDKKTTIFGLEKAKSWVLLANYRDPTLIMNTVAFELGLRFNMQFPHHYVHVELVLNGEYKGSYVLTEQNQVGAGRVDIDEDDGFFVELDSYYDEDPKFLSNLYNLPCMIKSPEDLADPTGYDFVPQSINELEEALLSETFPNSGYRNLVDINSFVDYLMITEIVKNSELWHPKSAYIYKDKGESSKINMGPLWDYDWAFSHTGYNFNYFGNAYGYSEKHAFFQRFYQDNLFKQKYKDRWIENYSIISDIPNFIDSISQALTVSQELNIKRWNFPYNFENKIDSMIDWWQKRADFLNTAMLSQEDYVIYEVFAVSNDDIYGTTTGSGLYLANETVTLTAIPNADYEFMYWDINGFILNDSIVELPATQNITAIATFAQISGIEDVSSDMIELLPNPTKDGFTVKGISNFNNQNTAKLILTDVNGQELLRTNVSDNFYVDVSFLPSGLYFINIEGVVKKLVIY